MKKRTTPLALAISLAVMSLAPSAALAQSATGTWRTPTSEQGYLDVTITACGAALCGTISKAYDTQGKPAPYEHIGRRMIWDMQADGAAAWKDGKIWDPRNGRTFNSKMVLRGNTLAVSGCVLRICQSQDWTRVR